MRTIVSEKGQITIPKAVREELGVRPGTVLEVAAVEGRPIVCECVVAEVRPALESGAALEEFLADLSIDFVPTTRETAMPAGEHFARYLALLDPSHGE